MIDRAWGHVPVPLQWRLGGPEHPVQAQENTRKFRSTLLPRRSPACMRRLPRAAMRQRPPSLGSGGSTVVQLSGHRTAITPGAALVLDRGKEWCVPLEPLHAGGAFRGRPGSVGRRRGHVYLFSRFFPSIPWYGLYKLSSGGSAQLAGGAANRGSSQRLCGSFVSSELEADA
jgi:hypothetical protein